ncbi:MAG: hypothetical protein RL483_927 [Pseudomonadota bacterium]
MVLIKKNSTRYPSGLEWRLFKKLPHLFLLGISGFGLLWMGVNYWPWDGPVQEVSATIGRLEFALIGSLIFYLSMLVAVFFGCVMVMIMKGPEYRADGIELTDSDSLK